jgi:hypothetical protein
VLVERESGPNRGSACGVRENRRSDADRGRGEDAVAACTELAERYGGADDSELLIAIVDRARNALADLQARHDRDEE